MLLIPLPISSTTILQRCGAPAEASLWAGNSTVGRQQHLVHVCRSSKRWIKQFLTYSWRPMNKSCSNHLKVSRFQSLKRFKLRKFRIWICKRFTLDICAVYDFETFDVSSVEPLDVSILKTFNPSKMQFNVSKMQCRRLQSQMVACAGPGIQQCGEIKKLPDLRSALGVQCGSQGRIPIACKSVPP